MNEADIDLGVMTPADVQVLCEWAAAEGWNPGLNDLGIAYELEPHAFIAMRRDGEFVGGGSIVTHGRSFGFMGMFIVAPGLRRAGLGARLWHHRLALLRSRLDAGAPIGMDGVFAMVPFYERGGFELSHRDIRFEGPAPEVFGDRSGATAVDGAAAPTPLIEAVVELDAAHSVIERHEFMRRWVTAPGVVLATAEAHGALVGAAVLRPCRVGWRFGPFVAPDITVARSLVAAALAGREGEQVQLDTPEHNEIGRQLVAELGLVESFGCARMYHGSSPRRPGPHEVGVTSFEFG